MSDAQSAVQSLHRQLLAWLVVRQLTVDGTIAYLAVGVGVLLMRFAGVSSRACVLFAVISAALIAVFAIIRAVRRAPAISSVAAVVDARLGCGGLLAASSTVPLGAWTLPEGRAPRVVWDGRNKMLALAASVGFALAALYVPMRLGDSRHNVAIEGDVRRVEGRIDLLKEEKLIAPERADNFKQTLESVQRTGVAEEAAKAWETVDAIDAATQKIAADAAEDAIREAEALNRVDALAGALDANGLDASTVANGARELATETANASAQNEQMMRDLPAKTRAAIEKNSLTPADMRAIAAAARSGKSALRKTLAKMGKGGLVDPKMLRKFDDAASGIDRDALAEYLREHRGTNLGNGLAECRTPGRGGVDRGRGDAAMWFGEKSDDHDMRFKDRTLPPAAAAALADSDLTGMSAAAPDASHPSAAPGGVAALKSGAASAFTTTVLPRHRGTVTRFFERKPR
jgi:hypothetical protein